MSLNTISNQSTSNQSNTDEQSIDNLSKRLQTTAYVFIFILSVVGNSLVLIVMKKNLNGARKVVTNLLIAHLATADIVTTICGIPIMVWRIWKEEEWFNEEILGKILCKLDPFILETAFATSAFTISLIAFERFVVVYYPTRKVLSCRRAFGVGLIMWLIASLFYSPKLYTLTVVKYRNIFVCSALDHLIYPWRKIEIIMFLVLLVLTLIFYLAIIIKIRMYHNAQLSSPQTRQRLGARKKMNRRVLLQSSAIVFVHYFCWMPYLFIYVSCLLSKSSLDLCHNKMLIRFLALYFGYCNAAANPLIYATLSETFRSGFRQLLCQISSCGSDKVNSPTRIHQAHHHMAALVSIQDRLFQQKHIHSDVANPGNNFNRETKLEQMELRQLQTP